MQRIITILLAFALYAPNIASILAYSECELIAKLNSKPDCDCKLTTTPQQSNPQSLPDKHKEIVQQTDWKYTVNNVYQTSLLVESTTNKAFQQYQSPYNSLLTANSIFHPPCCSLLFTV